MPSIIVLDLFTDKIVAEYTGRPKFADDFFEVVLKLLEFYNAVALYENDKKGLFRYFDYKNKLHLLADTPQHLKDMDVIKSVGYGNKAKGVNSSKVINSYGRRLYRDWLLTESNQQEFDEEGNQVGTKLNMHTIRSICLVEETIQWNIDGNFDRVSAMGMLMIYRAEMMKYLESSIENEGRDNSKNIANDVYFMKNCPIH